jgi:hypothetical protein
MGFNGTYAAAKRSVKGGDDGISIFRQIFWALGWPKARVCSKSGLFWVADTKSRVTFKLKERVMLIIAKENPCCN